MAVKFIGGPADCQVLIVMKTPPFFRVPDPEGKAMALYQRVERGKTIAEELAAFGYLRYDHIG